MTLRDHLRGRVRLSAGRDFLERVRELLPGFRGFRRHLQLAERSDRGTFRDARRLASRDRHVAALCVPERLRRARADARQQPHHALEGDLVARVHDELQERRDILDVRLLEEAQPARDLKRDAVPRQLHLHFHRVIVRAVEHRDLVRARSPPRADRGCAARRRAPADCESPSGTSAGFIGAAARAATSSLRTGSRSPRSPHSPPRECRARCGSSSRSCRPSRSGSASGNSRMFLKFAPRHE